MASDRTAPARDAEQSGTILWSTPEWRAGAVAWLDEQLSKAGMARIGDAEQPHLRPWATALAVQTDRGKVWLKAACPGTRFEIALYPLLARAAPRWVLEPIAVDTDRGWIVLPDGGTVLGDAASGDELASALARVLPAYAELQRALIPHAAELIAQGVADMRAARSAIGVVPQELVLDTFFTVRQTLATVNAPQDISDPPPFNNVTITNVTLTDVKDSPVGGHIALDGTYVITTYKGIGIGVGGFVRYAGASLDLPTTAGMTRDTDLKAGGTQGALGLRFRY